MNKSELVEAIANGSGVTKAAAGRVLDIFMKTVTEALQNGDQVVVSGVHVLTAGQKVSIYGATK